MTPIFDAILEMTPFPMSDFGRLLVCYLSRQILPESVKKPFVSIFWGSTLYGLVYKSLTFPPLSIARYSCIQLSQLVRQWRERKCTIFETIPRGDSFKLNITNMVNDTPNIIIKLNRYTSFKWVYKLCETVFTANISGYMYCTKLLCMFALKYFKHINIL